MAGFYCNFLFIIVSLCLEIVAAGVTDPRDVSSLRLVQGQWRNSRGLAWEGVDPCASNWTGLTCDGARVTFLLLSTMGLVGELPPEIGRLTGLQRLDLSYNPGLTGPIPPSLGNLHSLEQLVLIGCNFTGRIPEELGNLRRLTFLDLNSNQLGGSLPATLGNLSRLFWFDIANNNFGGTLPVELGNLLACGHFHFNKNRLEGSIPPEIFHENMTILHVLFDQNLLTGTIPSTVGLLKNITILRLDGNQLEGPIPSNISSLRTLGELRLSNNKLSGQIPDLSGLTHLQYLDLSNNSFQVSVVPEWISSAELLTTVEMENGSLNGPLPPSVLSLPSLETLRMAKNSINGNVDFSSVTSQRLQEVDLRNNNITSAFLRKQAMEVKLSGNPACEGSSISADKVCSPQMAENSTVHITPMKDCGESLKCEVQNMETDPRNCECAMPFEGYLVFRSTFFSALNNISRFQNLENSLMNNLSLPEGSSVYILCCMSFDAIEYLTIRLRIFPPVGKRYFKRSEIVKLGYSLSSHTYKSPGEFGPYFFLPTLDDLFHDLSNRSKGLSTVAIIGIAIGAVVSVLAILGMGIYILMLKKKAKKAVKNSRPFGSWGIASGEYSGDAPTLKGSRWFTFEELRQATNNFCSQNEIGAGGYGKVYRGLLAASGQMVAVKRAKEESMQGGAEFKTEIELLSRVHHKNLVGLIGFCFEEGEHMLVYEYMTNGSLRDNLSGKTGINLDWRKRIRIALGAARGLTYLHDHANPAIIHRDVKSSNILLDENLNPKVADFGLSKLIANSGARGHVSTQVKGTMGYLDPEYYMTQQLTQKSDVYSYGVVLLEILTSRLPIEGGKYLVREVSTAIQRGGLNSLEQHHLLDTVLRNPPIIPSVLESFVSLALRCCEDYSVNRPKMSEVVKELESMANKCGANDTEGDREMESGFAFRKSALRPSADSASGSFDYSGSGGYAVPPTVEPK